MIVIENRCEVPGTASDRLVLTFEMRCKSRLRTRLASGEEAGLFLPPGTILRDGDLLLGNDGRVIAVVAAPEALLEARCGNPFQLARAAYHLGNRHVAVQIGEGWVRLQSDKVLADMLVGLGAAVSPVEAPFEPEAGAYSHVHQHADAPDPGRGPARIHQYRGPGHR